MHVLLPIRALLSLALSASFGAAAATAAPATRPSDAQPRTARSANPAAAIVSRLDDPEYAVRSAAALQLNNLGGEALPVVQAALKRPLSPESQMHVESALRILAPRAAREERDRRRAAWEARVMRDAYLHSGRADPRFDSLALLAIDAFQKLGDDPLRGPREPRDVAVQAFVAAVDAGCDEPLVHCLFHFAVGENRAGPAAARSSLDTVFNSVRAGPYPPAIQFVVVCRYLDLARPPGAKLFDVPATLLPAIGAASDLPDGELDALAARFYALLTREPVGSVARDRLGPFLRAYAKAVPDRAVGPRVLEGKSLVDAAWDAHDAGRFLNPPPDQLKTFHERLGQAEQVLTRAWDADPTDARAATLLISVKIAQGGVGGDRDAMEAWFKRAVEADPDNYVAYAQKLEYLQPASNGSAAAMTAFGRECLATRNWRAGLPHLLVQAHEFLAESSGDSNAYYARPDVWRDISEVFEGNVLNFPDDHYHRSRYAQVAARCGHWDVADRQFKALGDHADRAVFISDASLDYLRKKAARLGNAPSAP